MQRAGPEGRRRFLREAMLAAGAAAGLAASTERALAGERANSDSAERGGADRASGSAVAPNAGDPAIIELQPAARAWASPWRHAATGCRRNTSATCSAANRRA